MSDHFGKCADCGQVKWPLLKLREGDDWVCPECLQDRVKAAQVIKHVKQSRVWDRYELLGGQLYRNGRPVVSVGTIGSAVRLVLDLFEVFGKSLRWIEFSSDSRANVSVIYSGDAACSDVHRMFRELLPVGIEVDVSQAGL